VAFLARIQQFQSILTAKVPVEDDQIEAALVHEPFRLLGRTGCNHIESFGHEVEGQQLAKAGIVVNDKDAWLDGFAWN
jgi:hypothetical protein